MRLPRTVRIIGCIALATSVAAGIVGCGSGAADDYGDEATNVVVEGISPEAFVDGAGVTWCVYPDLDELDGVDGINTIVGTYCGEVFDSMGNPVTQQYWVEAGEPDNFVDTDTSMSTLVWIYYLTYLDDWYLSSMFMNAYLPAGVQDSYKAKHSGYSTKYAAYTSRYAPLGAYRTRSGVSVTRDQLSDRYRIAPPSCNLVVLAKDGITVVPVGTKKPRNKPTANRPTGGAKPTNTRPTYAPPSVSATRAC